MTLAAASTAAPRPPGSKYGGHSGCSGAACCYGELGDRCACGGLLSAYNPRDRCNLCGGGKKRSRRRGASTSAHGEAVTSAAPAPRHIPGEEIDMAAEQRRVKKQRQEDALAYLQRDKGWHSGPEVAAAIGVPKGSIFGILGRMVGDGKLESRNSAKGGGYRLRATGGVVKAHKTAPPKPTEPPNEVFRGGQRPPFDSAPAGPAGAAPVTAELDPEQPASEAPAPSPEPLQAPVPFAGLTQTYLEGVSLSTELRILSDLEDLTDDVRERVLQYAVSRWPLP
ncbi:MAG TPA: hypothetical protein VIK32_02690 [Candidatus Limnocylindrales bacterium]